MKCGHRRTTGGGIADAAARHAARKTAVVSPSPRGTAAARGRRRMAAVYAPGRGGRSRRAAAKGRARSRPPPLC
ncbi:hypothetical protein ABT173_26240, partial [Streptomyces sp. NPDC001795]|uniref:hypothetical protein n=1 Tax=Streptomyces sp. NPDC001795 TaxID=3154525 RepID=UPI00332CABDC